MKTIAYVGPQRPGVVIAKTGQRANFGQPVKVEDDVLAAALLEQSVWEEAKSASAPAPQPKEK